MAAIDHCWSNKTGPLFGCFVVVCFVCLGVFFVIWGVSIFKYFLFFFKTPPRCSDPGMDFFFCGIFVPRTNRTPQRHCKRHYMLY